MKIDFQEKIDDYVLGKMSAEDRDKFEKEVSQDIEKQEQLKLTQYVSTAIKSHNEKLAMIQEWEQKRAAFNRKIMAWASSAIGVAAVLLVGVFLFVPKEDSIEDNRLISMDGVGSHGLRIEIESFNGPKIYKDETYRNHKNIEMKNMTEEQKEIVQQKIEEFSILLNLIKDENNTMNSKNFHLRELRDLFLPLDVVKKMKIEPIEIIVEGNHYRKTFSLERFFKYILNRLPPKEQRIKLKSIDLFELNKTSIDDKSFFIYLNRFDLSNGKNQRRKIELNLDEKESIEAITEKFFLGNMVFEVLY